MSKKKDAENFLDTIGFFDSLLVQFIICVTIDILFVLDNFVFGIGEVADFPQAFIQVIFLELLIGKEKGARLFQIFGFIEEIIPVPFLDIFPTCTVAFFYKIWVMSK